jgi:hypothetical protein
VPNALIEKLNSIEVQLPFDNTVDEIEVPNPSTRTYIGASDRSRVRIN